jgi:hypothetical protein
VKNRFQSLPFECNLQRYTKEPHNPIKQDEKKGVLRDYKHGDMLFNYGGAGTLNPKP